MLPYVRCTHTIGHKSRLFTSFRSHYAILEE